MREHLTVHEVNCLGKETLPDVVEKQMRKQKEKENNQTTMRNKVGQKILIPIPGVSSNRIANN